MIKRGLIVVALSAVAVATALAADLPVRYDVDAKELKKQAPAGTLLNFELFSNPTCTNPLGSTSIDIDDLVRDQVKTLKVKGGTKPPKTARLRTVLSGVDVSEGSTYLQVTGTGVVPVGGACQAQGVVGASSPPGVNTVPWVVVQLPHDANGVPQPRVVSPHGEIIVDSAGVVQDARAGTVGATTTTDALQEGITFARVVGRELYIQGGQPGGPVMTYTITTPLTIPATQILQISGGSYVILYDGEDTLDLLTIDSCINCHLRFGQINSRQTGGNIVVFRPENVTIVDGLVQVLSSTFEFEAVIGQFAPDPGAEACILFDATQNVIASNTLVVGEISGCRSNIDVATPTAGPGSVFLSNRIQNTFNHLAREWSVRIGQNAKFNYWNLHLSEPGSASGQTAGAITTEGDNDTFLVQSSGFNIAKDVVLESASSSNVVIAQAWVTDNGTNKVLAEFP